MRPLGDVQLNVIQSVDDCFEFLRWLGERRPVLGWDLETTGLRWWLPGFRLTLAQFADYDTAYAFDPSRFGVLLEDVMTKYEGRMCAHNCFGFDLHALKSCGFSLPNPRLLDDVLLMSKIADAQHYAHSLDSVIQRYLGREAGFAKHSLDETFEQWGFRKNTKDHEEGERAWTEIARIAPATFQLYSAMDPLSTVRVHEALAKKIAADYSSAYEREIGAAWVTFEHVHRGLRLDKRYAEQLLDEMDKEILIVRTQLSELGVQNPGARQKIAQKLIDEGWVPKEYSKKSGKPKFDKSVLDGLDSDVVPPLLEWTRLTHWRTAYVEAVLDAEHKGRIYPSVSVMGAKTGRQSMSSPPLQQLPSRHPDAWKIRRMILPEEGESCVSIDYSAEEDRLSCHFSGDRALRDIFDRQLDKHRYTAAGVYGKPYDDVTAEERSRVKNWSYAATYGAQDPKLAKMLGTTVEEVALIRDRVNSVYVDFAEYAARLEQNGRTQYATEGCAYATTWGGRRVYADQGKYGEPKYYTLVNGVNQGTGADMLKEAQNRIAAAGLSRHIMLELHDEFLFSVPKGDDGVELANELGRIMAFTNGEFKLDITTSVGELSDYWSGH